MPLLDTRPPALDTYFRPGNTFEADLTWPSGALTGRTFTAILDAASLTVGIVGNVMTVSATAAQTTTAGVGRHDFSLTETTGGMSDDLIVGRWIGSDSPNAVTATSVTVTIASDAVTVAASGATSPFASLTVTGLTTTSTLTVTGATTTATLAVSSTTMTVAGFPLAQYERLTFLGDQFRADPAFPATRGDTLNYPGWDFADGATQAVQWPFAPPKISDTAAVVDSFWLTYSIALVWINLGAGSGNVRWQVEVRNLALGIDVVTEAATTTSAANVAASAQNVISAVVIAASVPVAPGPFSSEYSARVSRIGADAGDTLTNAVRLSMVSFNRVT